MGAAELQQHARGAARFWVFGIHLLSSYRKLRPLQSAYSYKGGVAGAAVAATRPQVTRRGPRCVAWAWLIGAWFAAQAFAAPFSADAVKATYLFRFASYVEWPESAKGESPFVIGVVGADDVIVHLQRLLAGMTIQGRSAVVRRVRAPGDVAGVHILYVGPNVFQSAHALRMRAIDKPILLVTDSRQGLEGGAIINFIEVNRNLRFEISLAVAERSGLKIDSALLSVAAHVDTRKE